MHFIPQRCPPWGKNECEPRPQGEILVPSKASFQNFRKVPPSTLLWEPLSRTNLQSRHSKFPFPQGPLSKNYYPHFITSDDASHVDTDGNRNKNPVHSNVRYKLIQFALST